MNIDYKHYLYSTLNIKDGKYSLSFRIREDITVPKCYRVGSEYLFNREYLGVAVS